MKTFTKILLATTLAFSALNGTAQDFESGGLCYTLLGGDEVAVSERLLFDGTNDYSGVVIIPPTVYFDGDTYRVTAVGDYAFAGSAVTEVVMPNSVTQLGESAFADATELSQVTLPIGLKSIPRYCFASTAVEDVAVPEGVTRIGYGAFQECTRLHTLFLPSTLRHIDDVAFDWCFNLYEIYCGALMPPAVAHDTFNWVPRIDLVVTDDTAADLYSIDPAWNDLDRFTIYPDEDIAPTLTLEGEDFNQDWRRVHLGEHLAYKVLGEDGELAAYTAAAEFYLPASDHDVTYTIIPTTSMTDGDSWALAVPATTGIDRIGDEPFSPVPEPLITARYGQIHIWHDNYRVPIRVWDIYGRLYFERFSGGNEAIDLPENRVYVVTVGNYVKKVLL